MRALISNIETETEIGPPRVSVSVQTETETETGDGKYLRESDELHRAPTAPAVFSGCETPELPSALVLYEDDDVRVALDQRSQQLERNEELQKKNIELAERVEKLKKGLVERSTLRRRTTQLETLSEENAQLNSDALRHKEAQQQLFKQQKELCAQITKQLHAAMQQADSMPQSPLSLLLDVAICYVDLLQHSPAQLNYIRQKQAPNPGPSLVRTMPS